MQPHSPTALLLTAILAILIIKFYAACHIRHQHLNDEGYPSRISGGYTAKRGEFPSAIVLFGTIKREIYECSGVAITNQLILTTAHCFKDKKLNVLASPGIWHPKLWKTKKPDTYRIVKFCPSENFTYTNEGTSANDFQILRTDKPMKGVKPALLANSDPPFKYRGTVVGIGLTEWNPDDRSFRTPDSLQALPVERVECEGFNPDLEHPTQICFQANEPEHQGSQCYGDSGGPIYGEKKDGDRHVVLALTSFGPLECLKGLNHVTGNMNVYVGRDEIKTLAARCAED